MDLCTSSIQNLSTGAVNQYISLLFNYLTVSQCSISPPENWPRDYGDIAMRRGFEMYDFVIVGAGSAGSVLANRLSENPDWNILILEAGGDPPIESNIPLLLTTLSNSKYNWKYRIEPSDKYCIYSGLWPRGKMLGGSSSMNGMLYIRGSEDDYNRWEALGNPTWEWRDVLGYFKKSEMNRNPEIAEDFGGYYHSTAGLLSVEFFHSNDTINYDLIRAAEEMGFKFLSDINANDRIGFTFAQGTVDSGMRASTARAFLVPAMNRSNLHIVKHAQVLKVLFDSHGVASGVKLNLRGREMKVYARKEVILSAGAVNTPQILMLSGIGPAQHLRHMGIPVIQDLPVGKNLQDHPAVSLVITFDHLTAIPVTSDDLVKAFYLYLTKHKGSLATVGSLQTLGFVNVLDPMAKNPDFEFHHLSLRRGDITDLKDVMTLLGYVGPVVDVVADAGKDSDVLIINLTYLTEKSRGEILLRTSSPTEKPRIIPNYLSEDIDVVSFIAAIRLYLRFLATKTFMNRRAKLLRIPIPECDLLEDDSDAYWSCYTRYMLTTIFHPVGTAKMGPYSDSSAVVDSRLRVKGVGALRVIDASIMPVITRGNTNAPTIMIGEKGADFIKQDHGFNL